MSDPHHAPLGPAFPRYWLARMAGTLASQMLMVALGWQMYDLTGSAWDLGLVGLVQFVPALLLTLPAGHLVDLSDRRRVLLVTMLLQAAVAAVLALAAHQGLAGRTLLLVASAGLGALRAFMMPASQALLPALVPPAALPRALALASTALQGAIVAGPALGGVVYAAGAAAVYGLSALGAVVAALAVAGLRRAMAQADPGAASGRDAAVARARAEGWRAVLAGLGFIRSRPVVLGAISLDLFAVLLGGATALLPIFAKDILHTGPWGLGLLRAAPAVGALATSLLLARRPIRRRTGHWLLGAVALFGLATIGFGLARSFALALLALLVTGAADMVSVVIRQTLVQLETPDAMRGRVSAVNSVFIGASNQLGEFESGAVAAWLGPVAAVVSGGAGTLLVVALWWRLFPALAGRDALVPPGTGAEPDAPAPTGRAPALNR